MKIINLTFIVLLALFLVGCGSSEGGDAKVNYKQGYGGLVANLMENAPPRQIYPSAQFKVIIEMDNQAAYDIINGEVSLIGLDKKYFNIEPEKQSFDLLSGRSYLVPAGDKIYLDNFNGISGRLFQNAQSYRGNYFLNYKYESTVEFSDTICINPKLYGAYDSGCDVQEKKGYSGQGAPVAIKQIEEITYPLGAGGLVQFRLHIGNQGRGKIDYIQLKQAKIGGKEFTKCDFQGPVIDTHKALLDSNRQETILVCEAFLDDQSSYQTTLNFAFSYAYEVSEPHYLDLINPEAQTGGY